MAKYLLLIIFWCFTNHPIHGQCPASPILVSIGTMCEGQSIEVQSGNPIQKIEWKKDGVTFKTSVSTPTGGVKGVTVAGGIFTGSSLDRLDFPDGIWVDDAGNLFIADYYNQRVVKWAPGATAGVLVAGGNGKGSAANQFSSPADIWMDAAGNMYIADFDNNRVQKWSTGATAGVTVAGGNGKGDAANQFNGPTCVFVDKAGNIYVGDDYNYRIQKWAPGATTGVTVAGGNGFGRSSSQLLGISDIFVDASANIYIADASNSRIQKWAPGATSGITVAGGNGSGKNSNQVSVPFGVWVDDQGNIYAADAIYNNIIFWPAGASAGTVYAGKGFISSLPEGFSNPGSLFLDKSGNLYVADESNYRVQKLTPQYKIETRHDAASAGTYTAVITDINGCTATTNAIVILPITTPSINITASSSTTCKGMVVNFSATATSAGPNPVFQWQKNGIVIGPNAPLFSAADLLNGDVISCKITSSLPCVTKNEAFSNQVVMTVSPLTGATVNITADATEICSGSAINFVALATDAGNNANYQWKINGSDIGSGTPGFRSSTFKNGDLVSCTVTGNNVCGPASSNTIQVLVNPAPVIQPPAIIYTRPGQPVTLQPGITGNIASYSWTPITGVSDIAARNPVVKTFQNIEYKLTVRSDKNCITEAIFPVKVTSELNIPNAFTPNGDGHNDLFRIAGGNPEVRVAEMKVYNRWGQVVFSAYDLSIADPASGWDGKFKTKPADSGYYVYIINLFMPDKSTKVYKGLVQLIR